MLLCGAIWKNARATTIPDITEKIHEKGVKTLLIVARYEEVGREDS